MPHEINIGQLIQAGVISATQNCFSDTCHCNSHSRFRLEAAISYTHPFKGAIEIGFDAYSDMNGSETDQVYLTPGECARFEVDILKGYRQI